MKGVVAMKINSVNPSVTVPVKTEVQPVSGHNSDSNNVVSVNGTSDQSVTQTESAEVRLPEGLGIHATDSKDGKEVINEELLKNSVDQANKTLLLYNKYIERDVHPVTHAIIYKLKDSETNEVISEFPPKKIQDMIAKMWEMAGLFVDKRG